MTTATTHLTEWLAGFVVESFVFAELADDNELHPDTAVKWLEAVVGSLGELSASDRLWLYEFVIRAADEEPHPDRRRVLASFAAEALAA